MMQDDVGFKSQQFAEQVEQRRDRYAQQQIDTSRQLPQIAEGFVDRQRQGRMDDFAMQHQQQQMQMAERAQMMEDQRTASRLAIDELGRQEAMQQIMWARELHSTDMIAMQKDAMKVDLDLKRAQAKKAMKDLELQGDITPSYLRMDAEDRDSAIANGVNFDISGGRIAVRDSTAEEIAEANKRLEARRRSQRPQDAAWDDITELRRYAAELRLQSDPDKNPSLLPEDRAELMREQAMVLKRIRQLMGNGAAREQTMEQKLESGMDEFFKILDQGGK